jgi:pantoate--beta-alanine ligase
MLARALHGMAARLAAAPDAIADAVEEARRALAEAGFAPIDYLEVLDAETLQPVERVAGPARVLAAAHLGRTRLIDNVPVPGR